MLSLIQYKLYLLGAQSILLSKINEHHDVNLQWQNLSWNDCHYQETKVTKRTENSNELILSIDSFTVSSKADEAESTKRTKLFKD